jgi:type IV pilus assembly protein PilW
MIAKQHNQGFTIIELLVAMAVVSIVMAAVVSAYQLQVRSKNTQEALTDMNQTARAALEIMTHEIRTAGCDPNRTAGAGIIQAATNANQLSFTMDIGDGASFEPDGDTNDPNEQVRYALAGGNLGRDTGGGLQPLARNVDVLNFVYLDADGNVTATMADVQTIEVAIVARSGQAAGGLMYAFTDTQQYQNLRGNVIFGPANDNFRRLLLTASINCYNLGN